MKLQKRDSEKGKYSYCLDRERKLILIRTDELNSSVFCLFLQNDWFHKKISC